jgi:hypothetical protein
MKFRPKGIVSGGWTVSTPWACQRANVPSTSSTVNPISTLPGALARPGGTTDIFQAQERAATRVEHNEVLIALIFEHRQDDDLRVEPLRLLNIAHIQDHNAHAHGFFLLFALLWPIWVQFTISV